MGSRSRHRGAGQRGTLKPGWKRGQALTRVFHRRVPLLGASQTVYGNSTEHCFFAACFFTAGAAGGVMDSVFTDKERNDIIKDIRKVWMAV